MRKLSVSRAWDEAKAVLSREGRLVSTVALALLVLPSTIFGTIAPGTLMGGTPPGAAEGVLMVAVLFIGLIARLTIVRIALGPSTTLSAALRLGVRRSPVALAAFLLFILPIALAMTPLLTPIMQQPTNPPPGASIGLLVLVCLAFVLGIRLLSMVIPVAVAEETGPLALLKRSWRLTAGNWWRLAGFALLFFIASYIAARAVGWVMGAVLVVAAGEVEPMSISALLLSAALSLVGAAFSVIFAVMLARIYVQLAGGRIGAPEASVPSSGH